MNMSILLTLEILAVLAIVGWMVKKRIASRGDRPELAELADLSDMEAKKPDRKMEDLLDLPNEEHWE